LEVAIRHLRNAPITEAIVDFRVVQRKEVAPETLREAKDRLAPRYPICIERKGTEALVDFAGGRPSGVRSRDLGLQGVWLKTPDEKSIGQFRVDGFTFNRLKPYTSWDELLPEALKLWRAYVELIGPEAVTRVALRYINHLGLPPALGDLDEYLTAEPRLPPSIPQVLNSFSSRIVVQDPERELSANVTQALEVGVQSAAPTLLLDIDAYRTGEFRTSEETLLPILSDLRTYTNAIFFGSLTEKLIKGYE